MDEIDVIVDVKQRRPGCLLIQAACGCSEGRALVGSLFDATSWLVFPTEDMRLVSGTLAQWRQFADECNERHLPLLTAPPHTQEREE